MSSGYHRWYFLFLLVFNLAHSIKFFHYLTDCLVGRRPRFPEVGWYEGGRVWDAGFRLANYYLLFCTCLASFYPVTCFYKF